MFDPALFSPIDYQTGSYLLKKAASQDSDLLLFYCYLAASFRQGSLFVTKADRALQPSLEELQDPLLQQALLRGYEISKEVDLSYVVHNDQKVFLQTAFQLTTELTCLVQQMTKAAPTLVIDEAGLQHSLSLLVAQNTLLPEQASAIQAAANKNVSCIWGGPGTGKTYTAGWLVKLFLEQHADARIVLAAPTGKAAANLLESIQRAVETSKAAALQAKTLHALLGLKRVQTQGSKKLDLAYDLILVDESSMIDLSLCVKLLKAVPTTSRIIFLGDPFQLPPIEPGEPFVAFVEEKKQQNMPGELITTKRQENRAIIDLADCVKAGNADRALQIFSEDRSAAVIFCPLDECQFIPEDHVKPLYKYSNATVETFFGALVQTRVLCPQRIGPFGTQAINNRILQAIKKTKGIQFQPIIITKNDYALGLTNGQVGVLAGDMAYFENFEEAKALRQIPLVLLSSYETAYCLSVHKSQGSEFGEVVLLLPEGSERFGRKMLYTAITRAKKKLTIYAARATLNACIIQEGRLATTLLGLS